MNQLSRVVDAEDPMSDIRLPKTLLQTLETAFQFQMNAQFDEAERIYREVIAVDPSNFDALHMLGVIKFGQGRFDDAEELLVCAMKAASPSVEILVNYGLVLNALNRRDDAINAFGRAISLNPHLPEVYVSRATLLFQLDRFGDALSDCKRALHQDPNNQRAHVIQGNCLLRLGRNREALSALDRALLHYRDPALLFARALALRGLGRIVDALTTLEQVVALQPNDFEAQRNCGHALMELARYELALERYKLALHLRPNDIDTNLNCGLALHKMMSLSEALIYYDRVLALEPGHARALNHRGAALQMQGNPAAALAAYDEAIKSALDDTDIINNRANVLYELQRLDEALEAYMQLLRIEPSHAYALSGVAICASKLCAWEGRVSLKSDMESHVVKRTAVVSPFVLFGYSTDPYLQHECAKYYSTTRVPTGARPLWAGERWRHDKLRIAYLSADFHAHATAHLITELIEQHCRSQFELTGVSWGPDDHSEERKRLVAAFDTFHDVRKLSDRQVAGALREQEIDILVDLKGYTQNDRSGILAYRPCPIQVSYLGFPGSMGTSLIDYLIADEVVVPFEDRDAYSESIAYLPGCYQVNDRKRKIAELSADRKKAGLPASGFVFCSFNSCWKITPDVFDIWMRLLKNVPGSVLWLMADTETARRNLRYEAVRRGVDANRLVFADRVAAPEHLARHRLADLFLDTQPCNAHTTASDALWAGLPILTRKGNTFAGRVAASILHGIGLPELIATDADDYERRALALAENPDLLTKIKTDLQNKRISCSLFDTPSFRQHIEKAFLTMWAIWQSGERPAHFSVLPGSAK